MNKIIGRVTSFLILTVIILASFCSCRLGEYYGSNGFPEGYTGGFGITPGSEIEYYWVENYDEAVEAIDLLKSHGSTFLTDSILMYDGDMFDTKYCFVFYGQKDKITYGENPYDRWATDVSIWSYAFFEEVSIEEIIYSLLKYYDAYSFNAKESFAQLAEPINDEYLNVKDWKTEHNKYVRDIYYDKELILSVESCFYEERKINMTDECVAELILRGQIMQINEE